MPVEQTRSPQPPQRPRHTPQGQPPHPTSGRENNRLTYWFIGSALVIICIVLGFNFFGPEGASRTGVADGPTRSSAGGTTGGPSATGSASRTEHMGQAGAAGPRPGDATTSSTPQAADSNTPPGRERMGAPQGSIPRPAGQEKSAAGGPAHEVPAAATAPASATPAAPPASR